METSEYLVTMTTHVPDGTPPEDVDDMRAREAAHTRELAARGQVLRLWRPPLAPGEWRTIGLFAAPGQAALAEILAGMPLRVWRTDQVTELTTHPNDPAPSLPAAPLPADGLTPAEFFVEFTPATPAGTPERDLAAATAGEAVRTRELAAADRLVRLWRLPAGADGVSSALGLFRAAGQAALDAIITDLPLYRYLRTRTTPLTPHPSDPAAAGSRPRYTGDVPAVSFGTAADLADALRRAEAAHGRHEADLGRPDPDWPGWYAAYIVRERIGAAAHG